MVRLDKISDPKEKALAFVSEIRRGFRMLRLRLKDAGNKQLVGLNANGEPVLYVHVDSLHKLGVRFGGGPPLVFNSPDDFLFFMTEIAPNAVSLPDLENLAYKVQMLTHIRNQVENAGLYKFEIVRSTFSVEHAQKWLIQFEITPRPLAPQSDGREGDKHVFSVLKAGGISDLNNPQLGVVPMDKLLAQFDGSEDLLASRLGAVTLREPPSAPSAAAFEGAGVISGSDPYVQWLDHRFKGALSHSLPKAASNREIDLKRFFDENPEEQWHSEQLTASGGAGAMRLTARPPASRGQRPPSVRYDPTARFAEARARFVTATGRQPAAPPQFSQPSQFSQFSQPRPSAPPFGAFGSAAGQPMQDDDDDLYN